MSAHARILFSLRSGASMSLALACCGFACGSLAAEQNYPNTHVTQGSSGLTAHSADPMEHSELQMISAPSQRDLKLASRSSPYLHTIAAEKEDEKSDSAIPLPKLVIFDTTKYGPHALPLIIQAAPHPESSASADEAIVLSVPKAAARTERMHASLAKNRPASDIPSPKLVILEPAQQAPLARKESFPAISAQALNVPAGAIGASSSEAVKDTPFPWRINASMFPRKALDDVAGPSSIEAVKDTPFPWRINASMFPRTAPAAVKAVGNGEADGGIPAPRLVALDAPHEVPGNTSLEKAVPLAARAVVVAEVIPLSATIRAGEEDRVAAIEDLPLASTVLVARESTEKSAALAGAVGAGIQLAYHDQLASQVQNLNALAPAAGLPLAMPMPDMKTPPDTATAPSVFDVVPAPPASHAFPGNPEPAPEGLSAQSKAIAEALPPEKIKRQPIKPPLTITHLDKNPLDSEDVRKHEGVGISISVRRPKANVNHLLEEAYDTLIAGDQEGAIALYKEVLANQPDNKLGLFGLATTYHRAGQLEMARPLYGRLLAIDPQNAEGLNNFLVLLADESPEDALNEMKKLERTHPDFSPLPAQMAVVYEKMGRHEEAIVNMTHAIELSPENIKYRYDMAIMLDKMGDWGNAATYYQQLITASERGEKIPTKPEEIQERLTFIRSNKSQAQ